MSKENSVVAIFQTHTEADDAVEGLQRGGVDMRKLSIIGKGSHTDEQVVGYYNTDDRMKYWGNGCSASIRFRSLRDSGHRTNLSGGTDSRVDRSSVGRRSGGRRGKRAGCWPVQHRNSQGQHREV